jgi:hypothetical protein
VALMARKSNPTNQATAQRKRVNVLYTEAARPVAAALAQAEKAIMVEIERQLREADEAIRKGRKVDASFFTGARAKRLQDVILREMGAFTPTATLNTTLAQQKAGRLAVTDAGRALAGAGSKADVVATSRPAGSTAGGKRSLSSLYGQYPTITAGLIERSIGKAVAVHYSKQRVRKASKTALNQVRARALTTIKSEMFSVYRDTLQDAYRAAGDVEGWIWVSRLSQRTCPICWTRHGTFHRKSEKFASHPNCQCVPMPFTQAKPPTISSGLDLFQKLPVADQQRILGPGRWQMWDAGKLPWESIAIRKRHPIHGLTLTLAPIGTRRRSKPVALAYTIEQLRSKQA